jgi:hypothetical protein
MAGKIRIFDVEHGACAMAGGNGPALAMIDCGDNQTTGWRPSTFIRARFPRRHIDYLLITNVDQDHISDLASLNPNGISIGALISNTTVSPATLRAIKQRGGPLTADAEAYLAMRSSGGPPGSAVPLSTAMSGFDLHQYVHGPHLFDDTNNLSSVFFLSYGPFKILFPGDIERAGWREHLANPAFVNDLSTTTVLVASHHGRESGYCAEVFNYLKPQVVVISDKSIVHDTQEIDYRGVVQGNGVVVTNDPGRRRVLTTRNDGDIVFSITDNLGNYNVTTGVV